jgi:uncharacterized metal-binding protein
MNEKIALSACNGMSPNGLVCRGAVYDSSIENEDIISICIGATSANKESFLDLIKKYPIISVNGCSSRCVDEILRQRGVKTEKSIDVSDLLKDSQYKPTEVVRLDNDGEYCVEIVKDKIQELKKELKE